MIQEEILQYNKRCADFMVLEISIKLEDGYTCGTWYKPTDNENEFLPCPVMYHSDWNWIREVVEAIEKIEITEAQKENPSIELNRQIGKVLDLPIYSKKEAVVQAINQFLIFYNNENS